MTRTEQAQSTVTRVDGPSNNRRPRRAGRTRTTRQNKRTEQDHSGVSDGDGRLTCSDVNKTVTTQRRPDSGPRLSRTETASFSAGSKQRHRLAEPSRRNQSTGCCVVASNSTYAGAKFTGGAPCASLLPLPPTHWLTSPSLLTVTVSDSYSS